MSRKFTYINEQIASTLNTKELKALKVIIDQGGPDMDFVDEDGEQILGPDGEPGWFINGKLERALSIYDFKTIRKAVSMYYDLGIDEFRERMSGKYYSRY